MMWLETVVSWVSRLETCTERFRAWKPFLRKIPGNIKKPYSSASFRLCPRLRSPSSVSFFFSFET